MECMPRLFLIVSGWMFGFFLACGSVNAGEAEFDRYVVHYNVLNTTYLPLEVARAYDVRRSSNRALVNVVILKREGERESWPGVVSGHAVNLNGQRRPLRFRQVRDGDAYYHLAEVRVRPGDELEFRVRVTAAGDNETLPLVFRKTFFAH